VILVEATARTAEIFEAQVLFAARLAACGHGTGVSDAWVPDDIGRALRYEAAPYLRPAGGLAPDHLIVLAADQADADAMAALRSYAGKVREVSAIGTFDSPQDALSARLRLGYTLGTEPRLVDLSAFPGSSLVPGAALPAFASGNAETGGKPEGLVVLLSDELAEDQATRQALAALSFHPGLRLSIVSQGNDEAIAAALVLSDLRRCRLPDLPPSALAAGAAALVYLSNASADQRSGALIDEMLALRRPVVDASRDGVIVATGTPALRGPRAVAALGPYLDTTVFPNLGQIARQLGRNDRVLAGDFARIEAALGLNRPPAPKRRSTADEAPVLFMPTNGVGLGHAQRCCLVAAAMRQRDKVRFAAFPSCLGLISRRGFPATPLVSRSDEHADAYANDIVNYRRLGTAVARGGVFVFDGGYVFDSIFRTIHERALRGIWIRRGLWQAAHRTWKMADRERAFAQIIQPGEVFPELDDALSFRPEVHRVGPIVNHHILTAAGRAALRDRLRQQPGLPEGRLVVSMLGAGVAADRTAHVQAIAAQVERMDDVRHLVVVWPGATVAPQLYGWSRTTVVQTERATELMQAADAVVSAAGYNSVGEVLYHRLPAILLPQMSPTQDDQTRRARAAAERGLAELVEAHEVFRLGQRLADFLDGGRAHDIRKRLEAADLPPLGTAEAAAIIDAEAGS
jgi:UDP:flavonoid glycosyltransferase YjiC (YdhE family)